MLGLGCCLRVLVDVLIVGLNCEGRYLEGEMKLKKCSGVGTLHVGNYEKNI